MERYFQIAKVNWKYNFKIHVLVAFGFLFITPVIFGVKNLDSIQTAKVLEIYISILGLILLVPVFIPFENKTIRDVIRSKRESTFSIYIVGLIEGLCILLIFVTGFLYFLKINSCEFNFLKYLYGTMSTCIFLGGLGLVIYGFMDNLPMAYMIPMMYYIISFMGGKKYLGNFYLFFMMEEEIHLKKYLLISGMFMIILALTKDSFCKLAKKQ